MRSSESSRFVQELVLYAASAALSCLVLFAGLRQLDPNRAASQKAAQQKKEIAKRLGRPLVSTTPYEVRALALPPPSPDPQAPPSRVQPVLRSNPLPPSSPSHEAPKSNEIESNPIPRQCLLARRRM